MTTKFYQMKRFLFFALTLCFCINVQAKVKKNTVVFQVGKSYYQTLSITGNFEKGILTEGPVLFEYGGDEIVLEGTYSPANLTFQIQGHIRGLGCNGTIFITNGKPISKKSGIQMDG